jgi:hypothetical protein
MRYMAYGQRWKWNKPTNPRKPLKVMKDTRAGGGAFSCKPLRVNELDARVVRFSIEPGFFAGEKSPLRTRVDTDTDLIPMP